MKLRDLERNGLKILQNWRVVILAIIILTLVDGLIWVGYKLAWTGFGEYISPAVPQNQTFQRAKTLWDWMQLLIIPAMLAGGAYWLNGSARKREIKIAEKRAETERNIATDNKQETSLQTYLDKMTELLLDKKLRESEEDSEVRAVARARTLTVLRGLDEDRKGSLLRFLYEADLINKDKIVIHLSLANLRGAKLRGADLSKVDLGGADLSWADLSWAKLNEAILSDADLSWAKLSDADLSEADLSKAYLRGADLQFANLIGADLNGADLSEADLTGADLTGADLTGAKYTKNSEGIRDTIWPEGFDPDAAGAEIVYIFE